MTEDQIMESGEVVEEGPGGEQITFERFTEWMKAAPAEAKALMGQFMDKVETVAGKLSEGTAHTADEAARRAEDRQDIEASLPPDREDVMNMQLEEEQVSPRAQLDALNLQTAQQALRPQPEVIEEEEEEIIQNAR